MGRCGGGARFWRQFMQQQQQQQGGDAAAFQMPADMANFLGQFKGKELASLVEAHLPEYLRTAKINEMLNQFKTGEQAEKPVEHTVLLEYIGKFLQEILSPFGIDCDYFVDRSTAGSTNNNNNNASNTTAEGTPNKDKAEEATASASAASSSTEPKPTAPPRPESASASASASAPPSFGNLLEQLQTMFSPMFQPGATASANNATTTSQVDREAEEQKKIDECIERMTAMGFVDSNGILTELIKAKKGDLNQVLDALNPRNYKN